MPISVTQKATSYLECSFPGPPHRDLQAIYSDPPPGICVVPEGDNLTKVSGDQCFKWLEFNTHTHTHTHMHTLLTHTRSYM